MGLALRQGVTCCRTGGYTFFLDIERDRYFAIGGEAHAAFEQLVGGAASESEKALAVKLVRDGIAVRSDGPEHPACCDHPDRAIESAIDRAERSFSRPPMMIELARIFLAKWSLRRSGLAHGLRRLGARKKDADLRAAGTGELERIAAAFERCNSIVSPMDQCLPRSLAVAHRLLDFGLSPALIMGVRAQPFGAHAWVESENLIVNDRFDTVHPYTPILVL
jgi:hypothetical protein